MVKIRLEITVNNFVKKKNSFFTIKKKTFWKSQKSLSSVGVNPCFWSKNANFFVDVDLVKIRLEIILSDFPKEKRNLFDYKKKNFSKKKKSHFFLKGLFQAFDQKSQILLYLDLAIIRLEKLLSHFAERKETCFDYKKQNFSKSKKSTFPEENPYILLVKKCHFFSS